MRRRAALGKTRILTCQVNAEFCCAGFGWGTVLRAMLAYLGRFWGRLGAASGRLEVFLGPSWATLGPSLGSVGAVLVRSVIVLGLSCAVGGRY